jgi:hypothetical protein
MSSALGGKLLLCLTLSELKPDFLSYVPLQSWTRIFRLPLPSAFFYLDRDRLQVAVLNTGNVNPQTQATEWD